MAKAKQVEKPAAIIPMLQSDMISILLLGAVTGLVVWGLGMLCNRYIFDVYLCQGGSLDQCTNAKNYAAIPATLLGAGIALAGLIRLRVYRPLLVVIASLLSLWGIVQIIWEIDWSTAISIAFLLYALAFGLFSWVARIREFWVALLVVVLLVATVRFAFAA